MAIVEFDQSDARVLQVRSYLNTFLAIYRERFHPNIEVINEAAELIVTIYADVIYPKFKLVVNDKINVYKIAASHEQAIIKVQPFRCAFLSELEIRKINAYFAFNVALTNIECMWNACDGNPDEMDVKKNVESKNWTIQKEKSHPRTTNHKQCDEALELGRREHIEFLISKDLDEYPIHTIGAFLRMYYVFQQQVYTF
jgi:hypothetical protein